MVFDRKEYMKEYNKEYQNEYKKSPQYKKTKLLSVWKRRGLTGDFEKIYERYLNTTNCDLCNVFLEGIGSNRKCMDHCHDTGKFRNVVCHTCNMNKSDKKKLNNKSGYKNISFHKKNKVWVYSKEFKGKKIIIRRKNKIDILCIKFAGILLFRY